MSAVKELIRNESDGTLSFGDHTLGEKAKAEDFKYDGGLYKVKTFKEMTKLERDGEFVYESVPGTSVNSMKRTSDGFVFMVEGAEDAQITVELEEDTEYEVIVGGASAGKMKTNLGGKLSVSVELEGAGEVSVEIKKA